MNLQTKKLKCVPLGLAPSFGFGDRIGLATPGHVEAMKRSANQLEQLYLECRADVPDGFGFTEPGRQILHCTSGSTLTDPELGPAIRSVLESHPDTYKQVLADHFSRHLEVLAAGM